ncbi:hypothetical protein MMC28_007660 [Mycoblastus sanguinarius]|nr:hypothetical protein [Mycoblastus sanguinarius]
MAQGMPSGWLAVFERVVSIQPPFPGPLIVPIFKNFYAIAVRAAQLDPVPGRHYQRVVYGSLILEFLARDPESVVTREFVAAASLWLYTAAVKGFTNFFHAWVIDQTDGEIIYVQMGTRWDAIVGDIAVAPPIPPT